jgi:hypothetical protein
MSGGKYKTLVLGDAVKTENFVLKKPIIFENEFKMIFLKGAVTSADFNGLDRVFKGIKNYNGRYNLNFYLYGKNLDFEKKQINELGIIQKIHCDLFIEQSDLDKIIDQMHIGIGALAVHRKGLKSTSTIKTREYFARGLPFIYGHNDPDFTHNKEVQKYCLEVPGNDQAIDFNEIIEWYKNLSFHDNIQIKMRNISIEYFHIKYKMKHLKTVLQTNVVKNYN